jgi:hypothetical protein
MNFTRIGTLNAASAQIFYQTARKIYTLNPNYVQSKKQETIIIMPIQNESYLRYGMWRSIQVEKRNTQKKMRGKKKGNDKLV